MVIVNMHAVYRWAKATSEDYYQLPVSTAHLPTGRAPLECISEYKVSSTNDSYSMSLKQAPKLKHFVQQHGKAGHRKGHLLMSASEDAAT